MNRHLHLSSDSSNGFSLIEVLVALLILSVGLLGLAALQTTSMKYNTESYYRSQATYLAYDIIDRMRANPVGVNNGNYDVPNSTAAATAKAATASCGSSSCVTSDLAKYDLGQWYNRMASLLPGSISPTSNYATITRDTTTNQAIITINWMEHDLLQTQTWTIRLAL